MYIKNIAKITIPKKGIIKKLTTYIPKKQASFVREALFKVNQNNLGNYSNTSFNVLGKGTFKGNDKSTPTSVEKNKSQTEEETKLTLLFESKDEFAILKTLKKNHPYEEVAYEVTTIDNIHQDIGMGMIGELNEEFSEIDFLDFLKSKLKTNFIKHSKFIKRKIKKVAVLGGSGSFAIQDAIYAKVDCFVTADLKYHDYFKAENKLLLVDVGHYESEQYTKELILEFLNKKIPKFACIISKTNTNPVNYF